MAKCHNSYQFNISMNVNRCCAVKCNPQLTFTRKVVMCMKLPLVALTSPICVLWKPFDAWIKREKTQRVAPPRGNRREDLQVCFTIIKTRLKSVNNRCSSQHKIPVTHNL